MSSIGPTLPPHLTKRKRTPEDGEDNPPPSPPAKTQRTLGPSLPPAAANDDEINLESDDDDYGPAAPVRQTPAAGPALPPKANNTDEIALDHDPDSDDTGPAAPPGPSAVPPPPQQRKPSRPPAPLSSASDSDSDDGFGPSLPSASAARPTIGPAMPPSTDDDAAPQRDSWMLAPPTASGYAERDPTRMRNRKFASKAAPQAAPGSSAASIWTETPEEKLQRLQDAVLGRGSGPAADGGSQNPSKTRGQEEREQRDRRIAASIEATRGQSLYEEHSQRRRDGEGGPRKPEDEEDDPSKRGFDREKDMAIGGKIGTAQRRELITKAANFGGRFQKGSFL